MYFWRIKDLEELVLELLKTKGLVDEKDDLIAKNEMEIKGKEVIVKGNKEGINFACRLSNPNCYK